MHRAAWPSGKNDTKDGVSAHGQNGRPSPTFGVGSSCPRRSFMGSVTTASRHPTQPAEMARDILQCIGNTSLVALRAVAPANGARILLKVESENPTGSMKDRDRKSVV